jgi:hypothetical protein
MVASGARAVNAAAARRAGLTDVDRVMCAGRRPIAAM